METISNKSGAVFFVDILGMSALTNGRISLTDEDCSIWLDQYQKNYTDQYLAASILVTFREILIELESLFKEVTISQLSDCAFIWSENITEIVLFANNFMTKSVRKGLLCRAGMTYGEIIETSQNQKLGRFIVGKAVTVAANLEKIAKGVRILIDQEFPHHLWELDKDFAERTIPLFAPFVNPLDFTTYDEFKWYLCPELRRNVKNLDILDTEDKINLTKQRLKIANLIRCSPKFNWNSKSKEGLMQVRASINFISENNLLDIKHNFDWSDIVPKRDEVVVENVNRLIDSYQDYRLIKRVNEPEWEE